MWKVKLKQVDRWTKTYIILSLASQEDTKWHKNGVMQKVEGISDLI